MFSRGQRTARAQVMQRSVPGRAASRSAPIGAPAHHAAAVVALGGPGQRGVELGHPRHRPVEQRLGLGALEADGGALRVVLVVAGRRRRRVQHVVELGPQRRHARGGLGPRGAQGLAQLSTPRSRRSLATWPVALTLYWAISTLPSSPTTTVERITPVTFLPYIVFSP